MTITLFEHIPWQAIANFLTAFHIREVSIAILLTVVVQFLVAFAYQQSSRLIELIQNYKALIPGIRIRKFELITSDQTLGALKLFVRAITLFACGLLLLIYLNIILGFFDETKFVVDATTAFFQLLLNKVWGAFVSYLPNLISILVISLFAFYFLKLAHRFFRAITVGELVFRSFHREWARPTYQIVQFLVIALVAVMIFPLLPGFESPAFQGVGVFLGLLISLGSAGIVSNIIAGIMIIYMQSFKEGDKVSVNNIIGDIKEQTLLVTKIQTIQNEEISIPNSILLTSPITNYSKEAATSGLILKSAVTIGYDVPWRQVHELLIGAALATRHILSEPEPHVFQKSLDDYYVSYEIRGYTKYPNKMAATYSELHQHIQDKFNDAGVEIMSPHYRAHRDGPVTMPPQYLNASSR